MLLYNVPRSKFIKSMAKNPIYSSLTPMLMYAMKLKYNIEYEDWDKKDEYIKFALGKFMEGLVEYQGIKGISGWEKKYPSSSDVEKYRDVFLTTKAGKKGSITSYRLCSKLMTIPESLAEETGEVLPHCGAYMLLQIWLCNASLRIEDVMILDPYNWDKIPKAHDDIIQEIQTPQTKRKIKNELTF